MTKRERQLPTMHVSIRVPWHDNKWNGTICSNPCNNTSCLILPRISQKRDDDLEEKFSGRSWDEDGVSLPACASERGAFMADFGYERRINHPYSSYHKKYTHFKETCFQYKAYSAAAVPFAWMKKNEEDYTSEKAKIHKIDYNTEFEQPDLEKRWVQDHRNQLAMLNTFFGAVKPKESLVFFYAKNTPLTDDRRRVIVGIGRVLSVDNPVEYEYSRTPTSNDIRCILWERNIHHSIRSNIKDGFLLPYHELLEFAENNPDFNLPNYILHAPDEYREAFSMGTEHVTHDQAITVLLSCSSILSRIEKHLVGDWSRARSWIDNQLNRIWRLRGAFPGLGSVLTAFGMEYGTLIAHEVDQQLHADDSKEIKDPWPIVEKILKNPDTLPDDLKSTIGNDTLQLWEKLGEERRNFLKLISRFDISSEQASRWLDSDKRKSKGIDISDEEIIKNPYIMYEADREQSNPISVGVIDHGLFLYNHLDKIPPVPQPSHCSEAIDHRRGRALIINSLDRVAIQGHTLFPQSLLTEQVSNLDISPKCSIGMDWINSFSDFLKEELIEAQAANKPAWQLKKYSENKKIISTEVTRRIKGKRHSGDYEWRKLIDKQLDHLGPVQDSKIEECAREEKARALKEVYQSRFSVLTGPAGTGKTSLLKALLTLPSIIEGGVLLLAPTGKARVQMQKQTGQTMAFTLAQFLLNKKRYLPETGIYKVTNHAGTKENNYKTVIIDECSMLTEDQLAATLDAITTDRLILVGDSRQLPPIGAGRPFVDIVRYLSELQSETDDGGKSGYVELKTVRRQSASTEIDNQEILRDDVLLSEWFTDGTPDSSSDEVWDRLFSGQSHGIKAIEWETDNDLQEKLLSEINLTTNKIVADLKIDIDDPISCFEISLGGRPFETLKGDKYREQIYFRPSRRRNNIEQMEIESWQILSPVRAGETGVDGLNRWIQDNFRSRARKRWAEHEEPWKRKVCKPMGTQKIFYGDKVINVINNPHSDFYPKNNGGNGYIANGEIGLIVGQLKTKEFKGYPWNLQVEFSTQTGVEYNFNKSEFGEESNAPLELAYALTIHKSQGSEFGKTFVIIPNPCRLLSRELLYTALTRQQNEIVLFYQGNIQDFMKYTGGEYSETAQRLTNLFINPNPIEYEGKFLEENLIYHTTRGELVRSKSEKIIADLLDRLGIPYDYEKPFIGKDSRTKYPDFTIEDATSGQRIILEHLGMLSQTSYKERWNKKLEWYRSQGVIPKDEGENEETILMTTTEEDIKDDSKIEKKLKDILGL